MSDNKVDATFHPNHKPEEPQVSNLIKHANTELDFLGYPPLRITVEGEIFDAENTMRRDILNIITLFASQGHSGFSGHYLAETVYKLMKFEPLAPISDEPDEWFFHGAEESGHKGGMWQNKRQGEAFSHDGGRTYYLLSEPKKLGWKLYRKMPKWLRGALPTAVRDNLLHTVHTAPTRPHHLQQVDPQV